MRQQIDTRDGLRLRPWVQADGPQLLAAFSSADMTAQSTSPMHELHHAMHRIERTAQAWNEGAGCHRAVTAPPGEVLGSVAVTHVDTRREQGRVCFCTLASARGRGVAFAACGNAAGWRSPKAGCIVWLLTPGRDRDHTT